MTTNAAFIAAIQAMTVTGVTKHYDEPPASIGALPAAFPGMPGGGRPELIVSCVNNNKRRNIQYIIVVEATGQSRQKEKFGQLAALMDNLETALDALSVGSFIEYDLTTTGNFPIGEAEYWAIIADITVEDAR